MPWVRGNLAIREHAKDGRDLLLFQMLKEPRSHVKYLGAFAAASWEYRQAPDSRSEMRWAIVFHLLPIETADDLLHMDVPSDLASLRRAASEAGSDAPARSTGEARVTYVQRSAAVRGYALARAAGRCEWCSHEAPFVTADDAPFLEVHHIRRLTDGGPDRLDAVAALCPNCDREAHHGKEAAQINRQLLTRISAKEHGA